MSTSGDAIEERKVRKSRKRQRDDLFNQTFLSSRAGSLSLTNRIPFPTKLFQMLEDLEQAGQKWIASWSSDGCSFRVHNPKAFVDKVMPHYFRQSKYKSFQRQLHLYGFTRIADGIEKGSYYHDAFLRSNRELCKDMMPLKRGKRGGSLDDSQLEASSFASIRSDGEESQQDEDKSEEGRLAVKKKAKQELQNDQGAPRDGVDATSFIDTKSSKDGSGGGRSLVNVVAANMQEEYYHDKAPLMYFPPETQLRSNLVPNIQRTALPTGMVSSGQVTTRTASASSYGPDDGQRPITFTTSHSSEEGKRTTGGRSSDDDGDDDVTTKRSQRQSLLPDPSNPTGMAALENQYCPPLEKSVEILETSRRLSREATSTEQSSSLAFLPRRASFSSVPPCPPLPTPGCDGNTNQTRHIETQQQPSLASSLPLPPGVGKSPSIVEQKQQDPSIPVAAAPLLAVLQHHQLRSSLLGEVYREQSHVLSSQAQQLAFNINLADHHRTNTGNHLSFLNEQLSSVQQQLDRVSGNSVSQTTSLPHGQQNNTVPRTSSFSSANTLLTFQQSMNESYYLAFLQQQRQRQQGLATTINSRATDGVFSSDHTTAPPAYPSSAAPSSFGEHSSTSVSMTSNMFSLQSQPRLYGSLTLQSNQARPSDHSTSTRGNNGAGSTFAPVSTALLDLHDPQFASSRHDPVPHVFSPVSFNFPAEQRRSPPSTYSLDHGVPLVASSSAMMAGYHDQEQESERLCLPPPPPPPNNDQASSSSYQMNQNDHSNSKGQGESIGNSCMTCREHERGQQDQRNNSVGSEKDGGDQQDVSPANSGNSFDSNLFEPNPFYQ